jgi:hypothetical protein
MLRFKSFRLSQPLLAGIELVQMIHKVQCQQRLGDGLSPAEQFYLLAALKTGSATFADFALLMRQSPHSVRLNSKVWTRGSSGGMFRWDVAEYASLAIVITSELVLTGGE